MEERLTPTSEDHVEVLFHWHRYMAAARVAKGKTVLDVACGEGYGSHYLAAFAERVLGVDIDPEAVRRARATYSRENLSYQIASVTDLPLPPQSVDVVVSFETLEHLTERDQEQFLAQIKKVLRPDGMLLMSTPDRRRTEGFAERNPYHLHERTLSEFSEFLRTHFRHVEIFKQEVNLASFLWPEAGHDREGLSDDLRIRYADGAYRPTEEPIQPHIYLVALCSNEAPNAKTPLSGVCHEVARRPIEQIWHGADSAQRRAAELEALVSRYADEITLLKDHNRIMAADILKVQQALDEATRMIQGIEGSLSWKVLRRYQHLMDRTLLGRVLRPGRRLVKRLAGVKS